MSEISAPVPKAEIQTVKPVETRAAQPPAATPEIPKINVSPKAQEMAGSIAGDGQNPDSTLARIVSIANGETGARAIPEQTVGIGGVQETSQMPAGQNEGGIQGMVNPKVEIPKIEPSVQVPESQENQTVTPNMEQNEKKYIEKNGAKMEGLEARHVDERTDYKYVRGQIVKFAEGSGLHEDTVAELDGKSYDTESRRVVVEQVQKNIDKLFNSEQGRINPEKHKMVSEQSLRYLELITQAQTEGDISPQLQAQQVLNLVRQNIWTMAYQDRVASENLLGDHGVRHLVGHNIRVTEALGNELVRNGQQVRAVDRLVMHQTMIDHDLGYAMDPVRQGVNNGGFGIDKGHNVLGAKYERQRMESETDAITQVFSKDQINIIHEGVLNHDSSKVKFHVGDSSENARRENITSAVHIADNTHAFEDKLPELLYSHADTLMTMRLLKTAGEIGDTATVEALKAKLVTEIQAKKNLPKDDIDALKQAALSLTKNSYRFTVGRICGTKPELHMDNQGKLAIDVQESAIHQEVIGAFGEKQYDQFKKFVADITDTEKDFVSDKDLDKDKITSRDGNVEIRIKKGAERAATGVSDYENNLSNILKDEKFGEFLYGDGVEQSGDQMLSASQKDLESSIMKKLPGTEEYDKIKAKIEEIKLERKTLLERYMSQNNNGKQ